MTQFGLRRLYSRVVREFGWSRLKEEREKRKEKKIERKPPCRKLKEVSPSHPCMHPCTYLVFLESKVLIENRWWVSQGKGGLKTEKAPLFPPSVCSTSLRPRPFQGTRRAVSGGALAPEPLHATSNQLDLIHIIPALLFPSFCFFLPSLLWLNPNFAEI